MHNERGQGRKSIITDDVIHQIDRSVQGNRYFTFSDLATTFTDILRSVSYLKMGDFYFHIDPKKATDINKAQGVKMGNVFF